MKYVIGIDEVGRGALAGPVVVAAVAIPNRLSMRRGGGRAPLKDSKKLSARQRELWFDYFMRFPELRYAVAKVYPRTIEKINISGAANRAALRAFKKLILLFTFNIQHAITYLDGGLYLGNSKMLNVKWKKRLRVRTIVRADEKITAVKIASIIAKVTRDRLMVRLAKSYPAYGFEVHKGYGTKYHRRALKKLGPCEIHRTTFL